MDELPVGAIVEVDGVKKRHLGGGVFEPHGDTMFKRFDSSDCGPLGGPVTDEPTPTGSI